MLNFGTLQCICLVCWKFHFVTLNYIIATSKYGAERFPLSFFLKCVPEFNLICWYGKNQNRVRAAGGDANDVDDGDTGGGGAVADDDDDDEDDDDDDGDDDDEVELVGILMVVVVIVMLVWWWLWW